MRPADQDRALRAVARVRAIRERDSRLGLLQALDSVRDRERRAADLQERLAAADTQGGTLDQFVTGRRLLAGMALTVREAQRGVEAARTVAAEAQHRWLSDRSRVAAVEHLLEQRALRRAEEARRDEVRQVDDIVGARHVHAAGTGPRPRGGR